MLTPTKLGWMAGIIDLKGHLYIKNNQKRATRQIVLMAQSRHPGVIRELGLLVGTQPEYLSGKPMKDFMRRSCGEHCPEAHVHVDDRVMPSTTRWTITGLPLAVVGRAVMPLMTRDLGLQELTAEILAGMDLGSRGATAAMGAVNRLLMLGWPMPEEITAVLEHQRRALLVLSGEQGAGDE